MMSSAINCIHVYSNPRKLLKQNNVVRCYLPPAFGTSTVGGPKVGGVFDLATVKFNILLLILTNTAAGKSMRVPRQQHYTVVMDTSWQQTLSNVYQVLTDVAFDQIKTYFCNNLNCNMFV